MNYQAFANDAHSWMNDVCQELFVSDVFSSSDGFHFLYDYDFDDRLVVGFSIRPSYPISLGDTVILNQICDKYRCFYRIHSRGSSLFINFHLDSNG